MDAANAAFTAAGSSSGCAGATTSAANAGAHAKNASAKASSVLVGIEHLPVEAELDAAVVPRRREAEGPDRNVAEGQEAARIAALEPDRRDARIGETELRLRRREHRWQPLEIDRPELDHVMIDGRDARVMIELDRNRLAHRAVIVFVAVDEIGLALVLDPEIDLAVAVDLELVHLDRRTDFRDQLLQEIGEVRPREIGRRRRIGR